MEAKARYFTSEFIRIRCIILNCIDQSSDLKEIHVNLLTTSFIYYGHLYSLGNTFASTSASFELGMYYEIEFITDRRTLLSISASEFKTYNDNVGPFHPVKLLLHAHGHYEVRVNIVQHAETGKYEFDNFDFLRGPITNVSNQSPLHICPGLRDLKTWTQTKARMPAQETVQQEMALDCYSPRGILLSLKFLIWHTQKKKKKTRKRPSVSDCCEQCKLLSRQLHLGSLLIQRNFHRFLLFIATTIFLYVD